MAPLITCPCSGTLPYEVGPGFCVSETLKELSTNIQELLNVRMSQKSGGLGFEKHHQRRGLSRRPPWPGLVQAQEMISDTSWRHRETAIGPVGTLSNFRQPGNGLLGVSDGDLLHACQTFGKENTLDNPPVPRHMNSQISGLRRINESLVGHPIIRRVAIHLERLQESDPGFPLLEVQLFHSPRV